MKTIKLSLLIATIIASSIALKAQRTVSLHKSTGDTIFSGVNAFVDAYNAASNGDTIYLPGGSFASPSLFNKEIYVIGAGHHPDSTMHTNITMISTSFLLGELSDYSVFEGICFGADLQVGNNTSASYITFRRCKFNSSVNYHQTINTNFSINNNFIECIFIENLYIPNLSNSSFQNCIVEKTIISSTSNSFKNSIFLQNTTNHLNYVFSQISYNTISNCIFISQMPVNLLVYSPGGNMFYNNIFTDTNVYFGPNHSQNNNYFGIADSTIFVNQTGYTFSYSHNYNLNNPTLFIGNDQTQVGIYGGQFPFKTASLPINPHISFKSISNQTNQNGELNVNIKVNAQTY